MSNITTNHAIPSTNALFIHLSPFAKVLINCLFCIIIGQLHDDIILPQLPKFFSLLFASASKAIAVLFLNLSRIDKFKEEWKNEMPSGSCSQISVS